VYLEPVNLPEIARVAYGAALTERAKVAAAAPLQQAYLSRTSGAITGTRVVAFLSACPGAGRSTVAENLAYEMAVRSGAKTLLASFDLPPSAVPHLRLRYQPSAQEYFDRPADGVAACIQEREGLEVLVAPEDSSEYMKAAKAAEGEINAPGSIYSLVMATWARSYAAVLLDLPAEEGAWTLHPLAAANSVVIVARPTLADMAATRHTLLLLLERLAGKHRVPREAIYLVLNQVSEKSTMTPHAWHQDLAATVSWAPPIAAVIPHDPAVLFAQDRQVPPVTSVEPFARGIRMLLSALFPGVGVAEEKVRRRAVFRMPGIKVRIAGE
jgi:Flp pilus assembly CpaE family ATPase